MLCPSETLGPIELSGDGDAVSLLNEVGFPIGLQEVWGGACKGVKGVFAGIMTKRQYEH